MKRQERHHLKENEFAHAAATVRETLEVRGKQVGTTVIAIVVLLAVAIGYTSWRSRTQNRAGTLLAEAMAVQDARIGPPDLPGTPSTGPSYATDRERSEAMLTKFKAVADQYPRTDAGIFARYREGGVQLSLGNAKEAAAAYQAVVSTAGDGIYGQMARLGLAEAQTRSGEFDKAIETFKDLSTRKDGPLPVDGILMQLGRAYREAGKPADAQQTFNRIVTEFPDSQFVSDAKREIDSIKKG
jgi:TolA-binding protein